MSDFKEGLYNALKNLLVSEGVGGAAKVTGFDERTKSGGYCDTCSYEYTVIDIYYVDTEGNSGYYTYYGSFSELISSL